MKFFEINIQSGLVLPDISLGWFSEKRHGWYAKKGSLFKVDRTESRDLCRSIAMGKKNIASKPQRETSAET